MANSVDDGQARRGARRRPQVCRRNLIPHHQPGPSVFLFLFLFGGVRTMGFFFSPLLYINVLVYIYFFNIKFSFFFLLLLLLSFPIFLPTTLWLPLLRQTRRSIAQQLNYKPPSAREMHRGRTRGPPHLLPVSLSLSART